MVKISEFFFTYSRTSALQDTMVTWVQKFGTCTKNEIFGVDLVKI